MIQLNLKEPEVAILALWVKQRFNAGTTSDERTRDLTILYKDESAIVLQNILNKLNLSLGINNN